MSFTEVLLGIFFSVCLGFIPMAVYSLILPLIDRYEKEPFWLMIGVFLWGLIIASGVALVLNTLFANLIGLITGSLELSHFGAAVLSAPFVEETAKGLAVLAVFLFFKNEFDSVIDGIIYGSLVGFGFAAAENIVYSLNFFSAQGFAGLFTIGILRNIAIPFLHAFMTSITGIGLALSRLSRSPAGILYAIGGYMIAITIHFMHNLLSSISGLTALLTLLADWSGFFAMLILIIVMIFKEKEVMSKELGEEAAAGRITKEQYEQVVSVFGKFSAFGDRKKTKLFDLCGELALKKEILKRIPEEKTNLALIENLRMQISSLSKELK